MSTTSVSAQNLSHAKRESSLHAVQQKLVDKIHAHGDLTYVSEERQLELLRQLSEFELGRFLIETGGLNGYWTHYVVTHPTVGRVTGLDQNNQPFHDLEAFILNKAPSALATQERFSIFKSQIQARIHEGVSFASVPCGVMGDLLELDYSRITNFALHGIDLDPEAIHHAKRYAEQKGLLSHCQFAEKDAWELQINEQFDLLASSGLAIYETDDERVTDLYNQLCKALKPGGVLVTSFWTPPPAPGFKTEWKLDQVNPQDALLQKILLVDLIDAKWQVYRSEETTINQLKQAGFSEIEIIYDSAHIFPTVIAKK